MQQKIWETAIQNSLLDVEYEKLEDSASKQPAAHSEPREEG